MKWFNNPETLEDLKKQYKKLAFQNHPDRGGKTSDMQEINAEYEALFSRLKDTHKNAEGEFYTARTATTETATEFMDIIEKLIHMEGIEIEVCGSWVWVTGDTRPHKEELKALSFRWSSNKSAWYFHRDGYKKRSKKSRKNRGCITDRRAGKTWPAFSFSENFTEWLANDRNSL